MPSHTPLRRLSQGSLRALSHSSVFPDSPHGLAFLTPVLAELVDEIQTLQSNIHRINDLEHSLTKFNESFASWLYVQKMASLTLDWTQAPRHSSFEVARQRAEEDARAALAPPSPPVQEPEQFSLDQTINQDATTADAPSDASKQTTTTTKLIKKVPKRKPTAKEKRERGLAIEKIIQTLPLEFRGSDHTLRRQIEMVLEGLMDNPEKGFKASDLAKAPDLKEARVHKCFLALANRKLITKDPNTGLYSWQGM